MVDGLARARPELDGADPFVLEQVRGDDEVPVHIRTARREIVRGGHLQDEIRRAQVPPFRELPQLRHLCRIARRHALLEPVADRRNLGVGQAALVREVAVAVRGVPRRHVARLGDLRHQLALLFRVLVGDERERCGLPGPMACDAVVIQDRGDGLAERHRARRRQQGGGPEQHRKGEHRQQACHGHFLRKSEGTI